MDAGVNTVAMEATGIYWRPVYYALEGLFEELWLCNAQHVKNVPGRKTDLSDAEWLADVAAHGMVRPSFVPPPDIRELTGADQVQEVPGRRPGQGDPKARKSPPGRRREAHFGGVDGVVRVVAGDDRGHDRRRAGLGGPGRHGQRE